VREVTLIGGEAYLRDDWTRIARAVADRGMKCTMTTGGRGLDAVRAREARDSGIRGVGVSIDGLRETHDALRGVRGSFEAALAAAANLREAGVPLSINTQINRRSHGELRALFDVVVGLGAHGWQVQLTAAMGRAADDPELLLEPHAMPEVCATLAELARAGDAQGLRLWAGNNVGYFGPSEHVLRGAGERCEGGTCGAGRATIGIEANGDVKGCPSLPSEAWVGGNVRDAPLRDIWERAAPLRAFRRRSVDDLWGFCRGCYYAEACLGGCTWTSHVLFGRPGNNPYCEHRALELRRRGRRERLVRVAPAPGTPFDHARFSLVEEPIAPERTQ
jgi:radical SAM protein with 4Fe4S-binding SPASM domain